MERIEIGHGVSLLMERPADWVAGGHRPAVVWIHGGGWRGGEAAQFTRHMAYMAALGAVSFSIEYRLIGQGVTVWDSLADCQEAIAHLRAHAETLGIDPARIIAAGESAGGHLACCLGAPAITHDPEKRVQLVINLNGVVDMTMKFMGHLFDTALLATPPSAEAWFSWVAQAEALSPLYRVTPGHAPVLHVQGLEDSVVLPQETLRYHRALEAAGVASTLWLLHGTSHAFLVFDYRLDNDRVQEILGNIGRWLQQHHRLDN